MASEKSIFTLTGLFDTMSIEGKKDIIIQSKFIDLVLNKKRNILLAGSGGVGKSFLIANILDKEVQRRNINMAITSTTGVSALSIGGTTIHRWSGIKLGKESVMTITTNIRERNKECYKRWKECIILVIDEISMLGMKTFIILDKVARNICENDLPFGGKQLIVSGDFLQLPPVQDTFSFGSEVWDELDFRVFRMTVPKRYPDIEHFNLLMRIRIAQHTKADIKKLYGRCEAYINYIRKGGDKNEKIKPTRIYSLKKDVEQYNLDELSKLPGKTITYNAIDKFATKTKKKDDGTDVKKMVDKISSKDIMEYTEFLDTIVVRQVFLKPGAQVMLTYNLDTDLGLVNGSRGVILTCDQESVNVLFKNGLTTRIAYHLYEFDDGKVKMMRYQLPLILAWAQSCHKCQGATLDYVIMDLGASIFAPGMVYVMLSRVRTLDGLLISSFEPKKIIADPDALEFEKTIIEIEENQDREYERDGGVPLIEGLVGKGGLAKESIQVKEEVLILRGEMCGETVTVDRIPGVDKHVVAFLMVDCPEIYEIMDPTMWSKLKGFTIQTKVNNDNLYNKLLELLGLELENETERETHGCGGEEEDGSEEGKEDENEPGGPVEDLSSSEDDDE